MRNLSHRTSDNCTVSNTQVHVNSYVSRDCHFTQILDPSHTLQKPAPEIGIIINLMPDTGASFSCRCTTSNIVDRLRVLKAVNNIRSCTSARKTSAGIWHRIEVYGVDFWSMCQGH